MHHITIISVGKIKEKFMHQGIAEYEKRLQPFCKLERLTIADERVPETLSDHEIEQAKNREGERIMQRIRPNMHVIACELRGEHWSSEQMAGKLEQLAIQGRGKLAFIIGGSNGLSEAVLQRAQQWVAFSRMTFPHQLMPLLLLEQVYRAFKINRGEPYHK